MMNLFCCKPYGPYHPIQIKKGHLSFYLICTKPQSPPETLVQLPRLDDNPRD